MPVNALRSSMRLRPGVAESSRLGNRQKGLDLFPEFIAHQWFGHLSLLAR